MKAIIIINKYQLKLIGLESVGSSISEGKRLLKG